MKWMLVFMGGGIGSLVRYVFARLVPFQAATFPWATFAANAFACLILAFCFFYLKEHKSWSLIQPFILIGFCGGLSTFSTFSSENFQLLQQGQLTIFWINVFSSLAIGLLAFWIFARH
ncbi:MAG: putative fluoride ion transporter CrcB [Bacteroidota bacterium]